MRRVPALILQSLMVVVGVATLVFLALRLAPGDPVDLILGDQPELASAETRAKIRHELGLDLPIAVEWAHFMKRASVLDLGNSLTQQKPVRSLIAERLPNTLMLALAASLLANAAGLLIGAAAALRPRGITSKALFWLSSLFQSMPSFWIGPFLIIAFALHWPGLPVSSFDEASGIILPAITLALGMTGILARACEESMAFCLRSDYVRTARSKGLSETTVVLKHVLPNALPPLIIISSLQLGHLIAGAIVTETIFDWPGMGTLMYDAISQRDYPTVQGIVLVIAIGYVALNLAADLIAARFSPGDRA